MNPNNVCHTNNTACFCSYWLQSHSLIVRAHQLVNPFFGWRHDATQTLPTVYWAVTRVWDFEGWLFRVVASNKNGGFRDRCGGLDRTTSDGQVHNLWLVFRAYGEQLTPLDNFLGSVMAARLSDSVVSVTMPSRADRSASWEQIRSAARTPSSSWSRNAVW